MTSDDLDYIDMLCSIAAEQTSVPAPTYCAIASSEHDFVGLEDLPWGDSFAGLNDWMSRRPYERSPWVRDSVTGRCVPLLYLLAFKAHGRFAPVLKPFWTDGDASNMVSTNVSLMPVKGAAAPGGVVRNKYGARSTTAEYRKRYYADPVNKARNAAHQRKTQAKKRAEAAAIQTIVDNHPDIAARVADLEKKLLGDKS